MHIYIALFAFDMLVVLISGSFLAEETKAVILPIMVIGIAGLVGASVLRTKEKNRLATLLLAVLAVPPTGLVLFYVYVAADGGFHH
jgi:uncharacterized membrane protein